MTQKIIRLPNLVINKIAAGEVVENPATIIKELIENSLDAASRHIAIRIDGGGHTLIEVEDDGFGMSREDAILSLERHATSKISSEEDLFALKTMGFRGEALAAISSVSLFEIKTSEGGIGTHILSTGGKISNVASIARNRGTTMIVRSLFFNVPARKKFQKSTATSKAQVVKMVETIALAHPEVAFTLDAGKERLLELDATSHEKRVESILGPFAHVVQDSSLFALLSAPHEAKPQRRSQFLFVNRRPIFSPLLARAVQLGYGTRISEHLYPPFVLFLTIDPKEIDVNVHPQKKEVRFQNENALFTQVENSVTQAFSSLSFQKTLSFDPPSYSFKEEPALTPLNLPWEETLQPLPLPIEARPLALFYGFFLFEQEGVILLDLKAAHSRILSEELKEKSKHNQSLLWPLEMTLDDPSDTEILESIHAEWRAIGAKRIAIDALPEGIDPSHFPLFFTSWKEGKNLDRAAVRYAQNLPKLYSLEEALLLWRRLQTCRDSLYDPLGKKIWKKLEKGDLEQWMLRG